MKKTPFILLISLFLLTACQEETTAKKATEVAKSVATTEVTQEVEKTVVAKTTEAKTTAPIPEKKTEEAEEDSGIVLHQKNCSKCHGKDYYPKANSKMDSYKRLHKMVGMCDAQLGTELFPEELQSITDYLNDSFYKFKK